MAGVTVENTVDEIFNLIESYGSTTYVGEDVSQLQHMCQAAELAELDTIDEEIILSAFYHDIGHLIKMADSKYQKMNHEEVGAVFLKENGFSEKIIKLVTSHVDAKRYLITTSEQYLNELSKTSLENLEKQGGKMSDEEIQDFENEEFFRIHIRMRTWDDKAKVNNAEIPDLEKYREMTIRHLRKELASVTAVA